MSYATLARKEADPSAAKSSVSSALRIGNANDTYEQEADRVAEAVMSCRRPLSWSLSKVNVGKVQRQEAPMAPGDGPSPEPNNYKEAAGKLSEAFFNTDVGKKLIDAARQDPLVKGAEGFIDTLPGKIITGAAAVGAVSAMAATHTALPAQIPGIPLDKIRPGLSVKITYEGPVDHPTKAMITFSYSPKGEEKKPKQTESEPYRAETARIAGEQEKFRAGLKFTPGSAEDLQQKAEQKAIEDYPLRRFEALLGTGGRGFAPTYPALQAPQDTTPRLPTFESPFKPKPFHIQDQQLELKPLAGYSLPAVEEKKKEEAAPIQRKVEKGTSYPQVPAAVHDVLRSSGKPLDVETRRLMEAKIGFDFGKVRIHTDASAAASAQAIDAAAYTVGSDVVFASGRFSTRSSEGQKLLAHELAHTVQQADAAPKPNLEIVNKNDSSEREADTTAEHITNRGANNSPLQSIAPAPLKLARRSQDQEPAPLTEAKADPDLTSYLEKLRKLANDPGIANQPMESIAARINKALTGLDLQNEENYSVVVDELVRLFPKQERVVTEFLFSYVSRPLRKSEPSPGKRAIAQTEKRLEVHPPSIYGRYTPGTLYPGLLFHAAGSVAGSAAAAPIPAELIKAVATGAIFVTGVYDGMSDSLEQEELRALIDKLNRAGLLTVAFPPIFLAGAAYGIVEDAGNFIRTTVGLFEGDLGLALAAASETLQVLLSQEGEAYSYKIGKEIGLGFAQELRDALKQNLVHFTFSLGRLIGPTIVYLVLTLAGITEALLARAFTRILPLLKQLLKNEARLLTVIAKLEKRFPRLPEKKTSPSGSRQVGELASEPHPAKAPVVEKPSEALTAKGGAPLQGEAVKPSEPLVTKGSEPLQGEAVRQPPETKPPETKPQAGSASGKAEAAGVLEDLENLRQAAKTDRDAAHALLDRYKKMSDFEVFRRFADEADETAAAEIRRRFPSNEAALRKVLGKEYRPPHSAEAILTRDGKVVTRRPLQSGGVKDLPEEIRAQGFRKRNAATHTEAKAVREIELHRGDVLEIRGQYNPCDSCVRAMQDAADKTGATIKYWWPGGGPVPVVFSPSK